MSDNLALSDVLLIIEKWRKSSSRTPKITSRRPQRRLSARWRGMLFPRRDRVPRTWCSLDDHGSSPCGWQADERIIAHRGDGLKCHVAGSLDSPLVVLFEEQCTDQSNDGIVVGEDADDLGAPLDPPLRRSIGFVTGIRPSALMPCCSFESCSVCYEHPGQRHRKHEVAGRPIHSMSCELVLVACRLCDSPGCAESANP